MSKVVFESSSDLREPRLGSADGREMPVKRVRDRGFTTWSNFFLGSRYLWQPLDLVCQQYAPKEGLEGKQPSTPAIRPDLC